MTMTVEQAAEEWAGVQVDFHMARSDAEREAQMDRAFEVELAALDLPTATARDVWRLLAMTMEPGESLRVSGNALIERAHREAFGH